MISDGSLRQIVYGSCNLVDEVFVGNYSLQDDIGNGLRSDEIAKFTLRYY